MDFVNHYAEFYGYDFGEVVFDYKNNNDNLLILSNSFSNPINTLLASHFNKTYVIDPRYYKLEGSKFNYRNYIEKHKIDKVLIMGNITFFNDENIGKLGVR